MWTQRHSLFPFHVPLLVAGDRRVPAMSAAHRGRAQQTRSRKTVLPREGVRKRRAKSEIRSLSTHFHFILPNEAGV